MIENYTDLPECTGCDGKGFIATDFTDDCDYCSDGCEECGEVCPECEGEGIMSLEALELEKDAWNEMMNEDRRKFPDDWD